MREYAKATCAKNKFLKVEFNVTFVTDFLPVHCVSLGSMGKRWFWCGVGMHLEPWSFSLSKIFGVVYVWSDPILSMSFTHPCIFFALQKFSAWIGWQLLFVDWERHFDGQTQVGPGQPEKEVSSTYGKFFLSQNNTWETRMWFLYEFKLSGNSDYPYSDKAGHTFKWNYPPGTHFETRQFKFSPLPKTFFNTVLVVWASLWICPWDGHSPSAIVVAAEQRRGLL